MSDRIHKIIERLAEMFPKQDYQSRLERYIASHRPQSTGDIELLEREYHRRHIRAFL